MDIRKYESIIKKVTLFFGTEGSGLDLAVKNMDGTIKSYSKGEFLHMAGKALRKFGLVLSGAVQVLSDDINGERTIMASVSPGETFGESLCFLKKKNSPVYIYTSEGAVVLWLSAEKIKSTEYYDRFTAMIAERALAMNNRIQILSKITLREKLITYFTQLAHQNKSNTFNVPLNREDMATYVGTNRSALSRELSNMKKEGLIDFYKASFKILK